MRESRPGAVARALTEVAGKLLAAQRHAGTSLDTIVAGAQLAQGPDKLSG